MDPYQQRSRETLCPGCSSPNAPGAHFCATCGAPLSAIATTDPLGSVFAEGYAAHRAITQSAKLIVVVGMWLRILPIAIVGIVGLLFSLYWLLEGVYTLNGDSLLTGLLGGAFSALFLYIAGAMLYKVTRNYARRRASESAAATATSRESGTGASQEPGITADREQITCLACGRSMLPGAAECAACGWSYSAEERDVQE